jgi:hypothetical protein
MIKKEKWMSKHDDILNDRPLTTMTDKSHSPHQILVFNPFQIIVSNQNLLLIGE